MQLRRRDAKKILDEEEYKEEIIKRGQSRRANDKKEQQKREKYFGDNQNGFEIVKHHKTEYFEEQRIEKMLDEQSDGDEHDNDIGDDTEQDDDRVTSEDDSKKAKQNKKSKNRISEQSNKKNTSEPGPLDHLVEFILGDRMPTQKEYKIWLKSEQDRISIPSLYMEYNPGEGEYLVKQFENQPKNKSIQTKIVQNGNDQSYTKNLIQQIMFESLKQMKDEKVIKLDEAEEEEDRDKPKPKSMMVSNIKNDDSNRNMKVDQVEIQNRISQSKDQINNQSQGTKEELQQQIQSQKEERISLK